MIYKTYFKLILTKTAKFIPFNKITNLRNEFKKSNFFLLFIIKYNLSSIHPPGS